MLQGPPNWLQNLAAVLIPPACREEVLGDLYERYRNPGQYLRDMISTVPFVILSRIRRTSDMQLLAMEALLVYGSFLAAAWYQDPSLVTDQRGLLHLLIPAGITFAFLLFDHAFAPSARTWGGSLLAGGAFFLLFLIPGVVSKANAEAYFSSLVLVFSLRFLFGLVADRPQSAAGPAFALNASRAVETRGSKNRKQVARTLVIFGIVCVVIEVVRAKPKTIYLVVVLLTWAAGLRYFKPR